VARREVFVSVSAFKPKVKKCISPGVDRAHCRIIIIIIIIIVVVIIIIIVVIIIIVAFHGDE
jgi:flagellar basal body-associated protein FliL